jgi:hypothetical protein
VPRPAAQVSGGPAGCELGGPPVTKQCPAGRSGSGGSPIRLALAEATVLDVWPPFAQLAAPPQVRIQLVEHINPAHRCIVARANAA